jgi:hypothetical protein
VGFEASDINAVRAQATLVPAVALSDNALNEIKTILTRFYTEPNQSTYTAVLEAYSIIDQVLPTTRNTKYSHVSRSYGIMLSVLNEGLTQKAITDLKTVRSITVLTREQQQKLIQLR